MFLPLWDRVWAAPPQAWGPAKIMRIIVGELQCIATCYTIHSLLFTFFIFFLNSQPLVITGHVKGGSDPGRAKGLFLSRAAKSHLAIRRVHRRGRLPCRFFPFVFWNAISPFPFLSWFSSIFIRTRPLFGSFEKAGSFSQHGNAIRQRKVHVSKTKPIETLQSAV